MLMGHICIDLMISQSVPMKLGKVVYLIGSSLGAACRGTGAAGIG